MSPTAALQSVPGTSAARRRTKPRTQPVGSAAGRHPGSDQGNRQDDHRESPRSARPQRRSGTLKRRRTRPQRIKAGRTAERAYRLDFGLSRYVRSGYPQAEPASVPHPPEQQRPRESPPVIPSPTVSTQAAEPGSRCSPSSVAVTGNRPASDRGDIDQRNGISPAMMKGILPALHYRPCRRPQRCSQSRERPPPGAGLSPGLSPQDQPQGVTLGSNPQEPTRRSSGAATISPSAAMQRNPKTPKGKASTAQGRQRQGNDGRTRLPPRFRPFSVRSPGLPAGRNAPQSRSRHHDNIRNTARGVTAGNPQPTAESTSGSVTR